MRYTDVRFNPSHSLYYYYVRLDMMPTRGGLGIICISLCAITRALRDLVSNYNASSVAAARLGRLTAMSVPHTSTNRSANNTTNMLRRY
jgi:hypothetical protein